MAHVNNFERDLERRQLRDEIYRRDAVEVYKYDGQATDTSPNL
ncbi:hypothetical protein [Staphylococcus lugdunensis]|nr:hypothetical protein [Staphylococcus lugdunensis]